MLCRIVAEKAILIFASILLFGVWAVLIAFFAYFGWAMLQ